MNKGRYLLGLLLAAMLVPAILSGCVSDPNTPGDSGEPAALNEGTYTSPVLFDPTEEVTAHNFESEAEFSAFLRGWQSTGGYVGYGWDVPLVITERVTAPSGGMTVEPVPAPMPEPVPTAVPMPVEEPGMDLAEQGNPGFSETNVQVAGIDEADIIKTDGHYIYTISGYTVFIIKAYPGEEAEVVSTIAYDENSPAGLFINGDHLAVFGNVNDWEVFSGMDIRPTEGMTFFEIYDVSDPSNPRLVQDYAFEGYYSQARMMDDHVYFVVGDWGDYGGPIPLPTFYRSGVPIEMPVTDIYYFDIPYRNPQLVSIYAIDITEPAADVETTAVVVEGGQNLYMSHNNIFITYTEWVNEYEIRNEIFKDVMEPRLTNDDRVLIEKIKATDNDVLSQWEKDSKILQVHNTRLGYLPREEQDTIWDEVEARLEERLKQYEHFEYTVINRIAVDDGRIEVKASGKVPGHVMNQFSMDEDTDSGILRIATTVSERWSSYGIRRDESSNNVYALNADMQIIGRLEGLAETEQIYSTRFIGDKLYMVTFRQVDPFFVIDLSDPTDIRELGQLKIPGFSRYLHPYDANTLIGIGKDATETGRTLGLKISLFDVSDFENPKEIAQWVSDERYSDSTALYEHKAFLFDREKELLVIPGYSCYWERGRERGFNGAMVFHITRDEIDLRGVIDHYGNRGDCWDAQVERSLWIEDLLYTKSLDLLKINEIDDLTDVAEVELDW